MKKQMNFMCVRLRKSWHVTKSYKVHIMRKLFCEKSEVTAGKGEILVAIIIFFHEIKKKLSRTDMKCNGLDLTHYQTTNFRLFQTERVCRRQFQI